MIGLSQLKTRNMRDLDVLHTHVDDILALLVGMCGEQDLDVNLMSQTQVEALEKFKQ